MLGILFSRPIKGLFRHSQIAIEEYVNLRQRKVIVPSGKIIKWMGLLAIERIRAESLFQFDRECIADTRLIDEFFAADNKRSTSQSLYK